MRTHHEALLRAHRSYFNLRSITALLGRCGFSVLKHERVPHRVSFGWLVSRLRSTFGEIRIPFAKRLARPLPSLIADRQLRVDLGDMLLSSQERPRANKRLR